jgi:4-diphosphocytidyl-2-C-methyl-D-erythritol kinase
MIEEKAYGKVNLALRIVRRREDGYHDIDTLFQSIALCDTITLEPAPDIVLTCSNSGLPCDETNLAYQAAQALCSHCGISRGARIHIEKRLPMAAGLAGGSADCAAVLRGLNQLWQLHLTAEELCRIGVELGADVPFCIRGGTARGRAKGEELTELPALPPWPILLVHPHLAVHTNKAYGKFDKTEIQHIIDMDTMEQAVRAGSAEAVEAAMGNTFEELVIPDNPQIAEYKKILEQASLKPLMSGSGPTLFALLPPSIDSTALEMIERNVGDADVFISKFTKGVNSDE